MESLRKRSFAEQQVAMALKQMASGTCSSSSTGISAVDNLVAALVSEAPQNVAGLFAKEEALTEEQKVFLKAAMEKIGDLLGKAGGVDKA